MTAIIIVDQTEIPSSFEGSSLFVSGVHILDADEHNDLPLKEIAESLATALDSQVRTVKVTERQLATTIAKKLGKYEELETEIDSGEVNYENWNQGYTNENVLDTLT
jgi:hypothetical protein